MEFIKYEFNNKGENEATKIFGPLNYNNRAELIDSLSHSNFQNADNILNIFWLILKI